MPDQPQPQEVDEDLLELLDDCFADLAGSAARIDAVRLQKALGLQSPYLARRMLAIFDADRDGSIDRDEFMAAVQRIVFGSDRDKLFFAFQLHDDDGDHAISRVELLRMITLSLAEDNIAARPKDAEALTDVLFREADRDRDGRITFQEFEAMVRAHPDVLEQITRSEARWIAPNEDLIARFEGPRRSPVERLVRFLQNHGPPVAFLVLWIAVNAILFVNAVLVYQAKGANDFVLIARGCGACLNFNGALILVPMMRGLLTRIRKTWLGHVIPVDDSIAFHRLVGHTLFGFGLVHTAAHFCNYALGTSLPFVDQLFFTRAGITGVFLLLVFSIMWFFSRASIRRSGRFELFYFTHLLYVTWFTFALVHGRKLWMWAGVPLIGFAIEQLARTWRRSVSTQITAGHALRSGVTRLEILKPPGFSHRAGDYVFLRIPELARREWHPFTISSAPEKEVLTIHVRSLGNWTAALRRLVEGKHARKSHEPLIAHIDGPYGTPTADIFASRYAVLIGAGIGVTPFASVLESVVLRAYGKGERATAMEKAHFFWLNKDQYSFEWFAVLLAQLEAIDREGRLDIHICMTSGRAHLTSTALSLAREVRHRMGGKDIVTGLRAKTEMGAPDWEKHLGGIAARHAPNTVDVYFCGPHGLANVLRPICKRHGMRFRQEHF